MRGFKLLGALLIVTACLAYAQVAGAQESAAVPAAPAVAARLAAPSSGALAPNGAASPAPEAGDIPAPSASPLAPNGTPPVPSVNNSVPSMQNNALEKKLVSISMTGARLLLYLLFGLSVLCVAVAIEKAVQFGRENPLGPGFRDRLASMLDAGDLSAACRSVESVRGVNAALVREGLLNFEEGAPVIEEIINSRLILERGRLEKRLMILGTVGNNAPFIGLLGTVMGIIKAFHDLATAATQGPQAVMAGISEALIATAVGLFVAIPAVILFNGLKTRAKRLLDDAEANAKIVLAYARRGQEATHGRQ